MAAEDAVVDAIFRISTNLMVEGTKLGVTVVGYGFKAIGVTYYALSRAIANKREKGEKLTAGEVTFEKLLKSGEDIHAVWVKKDDLKNISTIAKQLGISFFAVQNGDELKKSKKFLARNTKGSDEIINFSDSYTDMVSISYRASDEIRMAHILEMFDTFDPSRITTENVVKEADKISDVTTDVSDKPEIDEVEKFMKDNGVQVELPPEVIAYEEVKNKEKAQSETKSKVLEQDLLPSEKEVNKKTLNGNKMCFEHFGFESTPSKADYDAKYIEYITKNEINPTEPNISTALYEQGCKIINGEIKSVTPELTTVQKNKAVTTTQFAKTDAPAKVEFDLPECYKFFGFKREPSVQELKQAYLDFINTSGKTEGSNIVDSMYDAAVEMIDKPNQDNLRFCYEFFGFSNTPTKTELETAYRNYNINSKDNASHLAKNVYKNALEIMEKSQSIRETLQAKKELHTIRENNNSYAKDIKKSVDVTKNQLTQ